MLIALRQKILGTGIGLRPLAALLRRVGLSLRAGVDVQRVWRQEAGRGSAEHRNVAQRIHDEIRRGETLAEAMRACDSYFPDLTLQMVDVGERTGRVEEVLIQLADHYDHMLQLRRSFLSGIAWPTIQLAMAVGVIGLLIWIMGLLPGDVDILGFGLVGTTGLIIYLFLVAAIAGAIFLGVMAVLRGWFGPLPMKLAMRIPLLGACLRDLALARLAWTLAMALEAGIEARQCLRMSILSTQNAQFLSTLDPADRVLRKGCEFHEALRSTDSYPDEFLDSLEAAELAGSESASLLHLSNQYDQRARLASATLTIVATWVIWSLIALIIIAMIFRLAMFYLGTLNEAVRMVQ